MQHQALTQIVNVSVAAGEETTMSVGRLAPPTGAHFTGQGRCRTDMKCRERGRAHCEMAREGGESSNCFSKGGKKNWLISFPQVRDDVSGRWGFLFDLFSKYLWRAYCVWTVILGNRSRDKEILAVEGIYRLSEETYICQTNSRGWVKGRRNGFVGNKVSGRGSGRSLTLGTGRAGCWRRVAA